MILRRTAAVLPGIGVSLMPKLICPLCWPAYAGLVSAAGLGFLINARNLLMVTALFLIVAVAALAFRARQRRGYGPAIAGLTAGVGILAGKFYLESPATMYAAVGLLVGASIWNSWPARPSSSCPRCAVPDELVKEKGI
jgi:hypothetical protein